VETLVAVGKLVAEFAGIAGDLPGPPSTNVVYGGKDLLRRLIDSERSGKSLLGHDSNLLEFAGV
jgi:hypothetical protein